MGRFIVATLILLATGKVFSQNDSIQVKREYSIEYLYPTASNRNIRTINFNAHHGWERWKETPLTLNFGVTVSYAYGDIIRQDQNQQDIRIENSAIGIGPTFLFRFETRFSERLSFGTDFHGGVLIYSEGFPAGGANYNFMWRLGGGLIYRILEKDSAIHISGKFMHVSNGKGFTPQNPSYEAVGFGITYTKYIGFK